MSFVNVNEEKIIHSKSSFYSVIYMVSKPGYLKGLRTHWCVLMSLVESGIQTLVPLFMLHRHLTTYKPHTQGDAVMVGDGAYQPVTHVGNASITTPSGNISLNEVLVCPEIKKSLLFVSKLCDDYPCRVYFDVNHVYVIDIPHQKVIAKGLRSSGLYKLKSTELQAFYSSRQVSSSEEVWHHRLAHTNPQTLQHLHSTKAISINKSKALPVCQPCQMGKSSRLQFFSSSSLVSEPLGCIHCDLWGPSPVVSNQRFRFYDVFVDERSRYCWFYPLNNKAEFFSVFGGFQKLVENQYSKKIKILQTYGGGEFMNNKLRQHLVDHGIQHHVSCPYTPQ